MSTIIEKIRAEVNRLKEEHQVPTFPGDKYEEGGVNGYQLALDKVLSRLSDLEKEEKPIEGLEEELKDYFRHYYNCDYPKQIEDKTCSVMMIHLVECARHFAKWGAEHAKECEEKPNKVKADFDIYRFQKKFCIHCEIPHCTGTIDYLKSCPYLNK